MSALCSCWAQLVRALCGDPRRTRQPDPTERQQLLSVDAHSDTHISTAASAAPCEDVPDSPGGCTTLIVMRHGHRKDEESPKWHLSANRPWDPPLSTLGRQQAREAGVLPEVQRADVVITSPFKRCLQTSAQIVAQLPALQQGCWLADWRLSEVCDTRVLFSGRPDLLEQMKGRPLASWMWGGLSLPEALGQFMTAEEQLSTLPVPLDARNTQPPAFPENLEQGLQRYTLALQAVAAAFPGKTIVVVTHGECVRQAVSMLQPRSEVFEVKHTGYIVLQKCDDSWQLATEPGTTGVLWLEE